MDEVQNQRPGHDGDGRQGLCRHRRCVHSHGRGAQVAGSGRGSFRQGHVQHRGRGGVPPGPGRCARSRRAG
eukprot:15397254-Heterocapsa_arctica.AAC.2